MVVWKSSGNEAEDTVMCRNNVDGVAVEEAYFFFTLKESGEGPQKQRNKRLLLSTHIAIR